jgi:hypothetical protein
MEGGNWKEVKNLALELLNIILDIPVGCLEINQTDCTQDLSSKERELWGLYRHRKFLEEKIKQLQLENECGELQTKFNHYCNFSCTIQLSIFMFQLATEETPSLKSIADKKELLEVELEEKIDNLKYEIFDQSSRNSLEDKLIDR